MSLVRDSNDVPARAAHRTARMPMHSHAPRLPAGLVSLRGIGRGHAFGAAGDAHQKASSGWVESGTTYGVFSDSGRVAG